jgi:hypothetical protein
MRIRGPGVRGGHLADTKIGDSGILCKKGSAKAT